jgi:hypothetical protein
MTDYTFIKWLMSGQFSQYSQVSLTRFLSKEELGQIKSASDTEHLPWPSRKAMPLERLTLVYVATDEHSTFRYLKVRLAPEQDPQPGNINYHTLESKIALEPNMPALNAREASMLDLVERHYTATPAAELESFFNVRPK